MEFVKTIDSILQQRKLELSALNAKDGSQEEPAVADGSDSDDDEEDEDELGRPNSPPQELGDASSSHSHHLHHHTRSLRPMPDWSTGTHASQSWTSLLETKSEAAEQPEAEPEPPPRGHLIFHTEMECANLGRVVQVGNGTEYELYIRHDTMSPKHRLWFYFGVSNGLQDQRVLFTIVNFSKARAQYRDGLTPLVRSKKRPVWQRLPARNIFYYKSARYKSPYLLSFLFAIDDEDDVYEFAYCYTYSYTDLQRDLALMRGQSLPFLKVETLCRSAQLRRVDVLTITDPAQEAREVSEMRRRRPVVFISARVHPGETPSSHAMRGLVQFLVSSHPNAVALRRYVTFVLVPMLNPDGVALGNYRTDSTGVDLNRYWNRAVETLEPSNHAVLELLKKINASRSHSLDMYLDLHAHSSAKVHFCLCNGYDGTSPVEAERNTAFLRILEANMLGFSFHQCVFDNDSAKEGCARRVVASKFPRTLAYTLELAFFVSRATPYDDVIMAAAPAAPAQGYFGSSLAYAIGTCPSSSVALPYYNHVGSQTLSFVPPPCSYINQPGSGGPSRSRSGVQVHAPPGYIMDVNSEPGYLEIGRGIALSIGHFYDLKMQNVKSSVVHQGIRQQQQTLHRPGWNSSPNVGALYSAAQGIAGKKKGSATSTRQPLQMQTISSTDLLSRGASFRGDGSSAAHAEDLNASSSDLSSVHHAAHDAFLNRMRRGTTSDAVEAPGTSSDSATTPPPTAPSLIGGGGSGRFRSAGRLLTSAGREWEGAYQPMGISLTSHPALNSVLTSGLLNTLTAAGLSPESHSHDPNQSPPPTPSLAPMPTGTVRGPMIKGTQAPVATPPPKPTSRHSLLAKPLRSSSTNVRKALRPSDDDTSTSTPLDLTVDGTVFATPADPSPPPPSVSAKDLLAKTVLTTPSSISNDVATKSPLVVASSTYLNSASSAQRPSSTRTGGQGAVAPRRSAVDIVSDTPPAQMTPLAAGPTGTVSRPAIQRFSSSTSTRPLMGGDLQDLALVPTTLGTRPVSAHIHSHPRTSSGRLVQPPKAGVGEVGGGLRPAVTDVSDFEASWRTSASSPPPHMTPDEPLNHSLPVHRRSSNFLHDPEDPLSISGRNLRVPTTINEPDSPQEMIRGLVTGPAKTSYAQQHRVSMGAPTGSVARLPANPHSHGHNARVLGGGFTATPSSTTTNIYSSSTQHRSSTTFSPPPISAGEEAQAHAQAGNHGHPHPRDSSSGTRSTPEPNLGAFFHLADSGVALPFPHNR